MIIFSNHMEKFPCSKKLFYDFLGYSLRSEKKEKIMLSGVFNLLEVEARSFISEKEYNLLLEFMHKNAKFLKEDNQITYYLSGNQDLRIQKNDFFSKIWLKSGKIHDPHREELEIKFDKEKFDELVNLFLVLGYKIEIKWLRNRKEFDWDSIIISLDNTKGYGFIIELEKISPEKDKEKIHNLLLKKLKQLIINPTSKEEFDERFKYYKNNWEKLI